MSKKNLDMIEIVNRIKEFDFPEADLILGIATGGIVPASLVSIKLNKPLAYMKINYRDEENNPRFSFPRLLENTSIASGVKSILLVDDVSVSGKTIEEAKKYLGNYNISSFVLKGKADFVLFPEVKSCVNWPWKM